MEYRRLGNCGTRVSVISLGGWINFEAGKIATKATKQVVRAAYEGGINFYDLADVYGHGTAEQIMGKLLGDYPRHTLVISSKVFGKMSEDVNDRGLSRKHIMESLHKSLKRLKTDYLDIYFCHRPDPDTPIEETARAMHDLIQAGKVLYWGTSKWEAGQLEAAYAVCERYGLHKPQVEQPQYSMLYRYEVEKEILPVADKYGTGLVVWSPLAMGMLTGKYDANIPEDSRFAKEPWAKEGYWRARDQVRALKPLAEGLGISRAQLALAWALVRPQINSLIIGATRPEQISENLGAVQIKLDAETLAAIADILGEASPAQD
jgi:voltage-dependent potassium channel beta subunit